MADFTKQKALDYDQEVAAGRVPGVSNVRITARSQAIGGGPKRVVWGSAADYVFNYDQTGEAWEVVSDSAQDNPSGTGIGSVKIISINEDYEEQEEIVALNGTTPVSLTNTNNVVANFFQASAVNAPGQEAVGTITLRKIGGGDRGFIAPETNKSDDGVYQVPAGVTWYLSNLFGTAAKGADVNARIEATTEDDGIWVGVGTVFNYQNDVFLRAQTIVIPEKSIIRVTAISSNNNTLGYIDAVFRQEVNS